MYTHTTGRVSCRSINIHPQTSNGLRNIDGYSPPRMGDSFLAIASTDFRNDSVTDDSAANHR